MCDFSNKIKLTHMDESGYCNEYNIRRNARSLVVIGTYKYWIKGALVPIKYIEDAKKSYVILFDVIKICCSWRKKSHH